LKDSKVRPEVAQMLEHDLEKETKQPQPIVAVEEPDQPHDSAYVYSQLKGKHTMVVFPTLSTKEKGIGQTVIIAVFILLVVGAAWGTAYELQLNVLNRPQQLTGTCAAPAVIENGGCFISQTSTDAQGNSHTTLIPAGTLNKG
jgi:hypothetical protein